IVAGLEQRASVARKEFLLAGQVLDATQKKLSLGAANQVNVLEDRAKVAKAEALVKSIESQIEETRITGREPSNEISAPLAKGRDFITERLRIDVSVPQAALESEQVRLRDLERSVSLGIRSTLELDTARARVVELQTALATFDKKLGIRVRFLAHDLDAATA